MAILLTMITVFGIVFYQVVTIDPGCEIETECRTEIEALRNQENYNRHPRPSWFDSETWDQHPLNRDNF